MALKRPTSRCSDFTRPATSKSPTMALAARWSPTRHWLVRRPTRPWLRRAIANEARYFPLHLRARDWGRAARPSCGTASPERTVRAFWSRLPMGWSNKGFLVAVAHSRLWHKADILRRPPICPLSGVKQTWLPDAALSACGPKADNEWPLMLGFTRWQIFKHRLRPRLQ